MRSKVGALALGLGALTAILLVLDLPPALRGPASWQWGRRPLESFVGIAAVALIFALLALASVGIRRTWGGAANRVRVPYLVAALLLVFAEMAALTAIEPGGLANLPRRVLDPAFTSYHTIARDVDDVGGFLGDYAQRQRSFPVHGPSQPPGRVLFFHVVNEWASAPGRTAALLAAGERLGGVPPGPAGTTDGQRAGALAAAWLLLLLGPLAIVPLVVLVGGRCNPDGVAAAVLLYGSVPSLMLFTPETDHLLLLLVLTAAACLVEAMRHATRPWALALAFASGLFAGGAVFVSLTAAAAIFAWALALAGMLVLAARRGTPMPRPGRSVVLAVGAVAGFAVVPVIAAVAGLDWPAVARECFAAAHRVQAQVHGRDYATWVRWNLWDFALFLGPPLVFAWLARVPAEIRVFRDRSASPLEIPFGAALSAAVVVLDVSGTILGETGRIWMFLMPLAVAAAAGTTAPAAAAGAGSPAAPSPRAVPVLPLALAQLLVLLALRAFVDVPG
jgi:hypothetical protein